MVAFGCSNTVLRHHIFTLKTLRTKYHFLEVISGLVALGVVQDILVRCETIFTIWYRWYNLKNVKNTHGVLLLLVKLQAETCKCVFF